MATCTFCGEDLTAGAQRCPLCLKEAPASVAAPASATSDEVYELPSGPMEIPAEWQRGAIYELELPARCPYCRELIRTLRVLRLKRTQVTFTSTLPRGGRVITCPDCDRVISAELTTL